MPTKIFVTELVNAFNLNNYFSDNIYTNFTVQGGTKGKNDKIVSSFGCDGNIKKYLKEVREEIINRHYGTEEAADGFYNLNCFPFVFDVGFNKKGKFKGKFINKNVKVVELANLMDGEVIHNLKLHFANEFQQLVGTRAIEYLEKMAGMTEEEALKCVRRSVQLERTDRSSPYLYCISFSDRYFKEKGNQNPSKLLGIFKDIYVKAFNSRLEECGFNNSSIFYEQRDNKLYIKDITDINVIKDIVRYVKERIAFDFKTPGNIDSKVENCKDAINDLIFKITGKFIEGYEYDVFTNKDKIKSGHSFALIPLVEVNGQVVPLSEEDAYKVKKKFYEILGDIVLSDITGKTESTQFTTGRSIYAFSNKQIALLLPVIMQSPIAYNQINGHFEFAVNLENFRSRHGLLSPEPPRTPPEQTGHRFFESKEDRDSGLGDSPPQLKDSGSSSGGPSSGLTELSSPKQELTKRSRGEGLERPPRQGSEREEGKGGLFQLVPGEIDSSQSTGDQSQLSSGEIDLSQSTGDQLQPSLTCGSSSIPSLRAWDSSTFLNLEVSNKESEKQQVTDESDQKSSDEYSDAKSQESESPEKKHGGGVQKIKKLLSSPFKKQYGVNLKRHDEGRDTTRSTPETPVTEKPLLSKRSASERRAKNNPPSGVTSPVTEPDDGGFRNRPRIRVLRSETNGGIPEPLPQDAVSKPNVPGDRNSKISKDSGLGSLERGQSPPLTEEFSDSSQQNLSIGVKLGNMLSELLNSAQNLLKNPASSTHRGVPGGPKRQASLTSSQRQELRKVLSPEMRKKLDANFFPPGYEKLLHLLYVDSEGLCSLLSSPEAKEQVCSVLPPEEKEQVQSGSPEEIVRLLHKFFSNQKISDNCLLSSKIDSPKIKKLLQEEIFV
ncbi:hypothetical protein [Wolbachia pipientis]|uniref:hypothetical protein n=1 Tax=Wolbachia pipientis TaxID=955 RepID=UPI0038B4E76C